MAVDNIKIRLLKKDEVGEIVKLHKTSIIPIWKRLKRKYNLNRIRTFIKKIIDKDKFFALEKNGKIIGCGSVGIEKGNNKVASIGTLLIDEKEQGRGYGVMMMNFLENYARKRKVEEVELDVLVGNPAYGFYKHLKYKDFKIKMRKKIK